MSAPTTIAAGAAEPATAPEQPAPAAGAAPAGMLAVALAPAHPQAPGADLVERLVAMTPDASARAALGTVLAAWRLRPLAADEPVTTGDLATVAQRRGLEHLAITGNLGMLRLLDVPALLELNPPGTGAPRWAAMVSLRDGVPLISGGGGAPEPVGTGTLEHMWYGQAHVFWRDFEALGPTPLDATSRGVRVARLQSLLARIGHYAGADNGQFDARTQAAVVDFQRSRYVVADGIVGPLTRVVLYAAAGGYPRPSLLGVPAAEEPAEPGTAPGLEATAPAEPAVAVEAAVAGRRRRRPHRPAHPPRPPPTCRRWPRQNRLRNRRTTRPRRRAASPHRLPPRARRRTRRELDPRRAREARALRRRGPDRGAGRPAAAPSRGGRRPLVIGLVVKRVRGGSRHRRVAGTARRRAREDGRGRNGRRGPRRSAGRGSDGRRGERARRAGARHGARERRTPGSGAAAASPAGDPSETAAAAPAPPAAPSAAPAAPAFASGAPPPDPPAEAATPLPVPPPVQVPAMAERPWAHPTPDVATTDAPDGRLAVALVPRTAMPRPDLDDAIEPVTRSRAPSGAPAVRLSFLLYSSSAERRSVALQIEGSLATLHEGDEASGVVVERILPDRAELSWNGERFTVRARD
ncbi:MAG: peptidoglycan-binding protein [bacterium]|nr:peptidoglycan-binding protein [bacterium]